MKRVINKETKIFIRDDLACDESSEMLINAEAVNGFYEAKWNGSEWIENMNQEQIDELKNQPIKLTLEQEETKLLKKRLDEAENAMMVLMEITMMGGF